jgi:hypothetical protein
LFRWLRFSADVQTRQASTCVPETSRWCNRVFGSKVNMKSRTVTEFCSRGYGYARFACPVCSLELANSTYFQYLALQFLRHIPSVGQHLPHTSYKLGSRLGIVKLFQVHRGNWQYRVCLWALTECLRKVYPQLMHNRCVL